MRLPKVSHVNALALYYSYCFNTIMPKLSKCCSFFLRVVFGMMMEFYPRNKHSRERFS